MKITIYDIAKVVGVTPSTVQRALNGVPGVSEKRRAQIQQVAEEMGYKRNALASTLKRGVKRLALVLPEPVHNNRYYAKYLWDGAEQCLGDQAEFGVESLPYTYVRTPENHGRKLREVYEERGSGLDGVLTMGTDDPLARQTLARMKQDGIPVVFVGTDDEEGARLCCVRTYDEMAGRMAADLLINFCEPQKRRKVIITGDLAIADQFYNAQGFERHLLENESPLEILKLRNDPDLDVVKAGIQEALQSGLEICAVYSTSARNTVPMCRAVAECGAGGRVRTIGNDIFPESAEMVRAGTLNAIIHKRPSTQAYQAMQALINYVVKGEAPASSTVLVDTVIVMKSNLKCF